jgi:hypothetical protein
MGCVRKSAKSMYTWYVKPDDKNLKDFSAIQALLYPGEDLILAVVLGCRLIPLPFNFKRKKT